MLDSWYLIEFYYVDTMEKHHKVQVNGMGSRTPGQSIKNLKHTLILVTVYKRTLLLYSEVGMQQTVIIPFNGIT